MIYKKSLTGENRLFSIVFSRRIWKKSQKGVEGIVMKRKIYQQLLD